MTTVNRNPFERIKTKVLNGERLDAADGAFLFRYPNLLEIATLANSVREHLHGEVTYYNRNLHLNTTNVCDADCIFCSFARITSDMPQAYTMNIEQAMNWVRERYKPGMTEIHIVNGLNPDLPFEYYLQLLNALREQFPDLHRKTFTAVEIHYFAQKYKMSYTEVLQQLIEAGMQSMPGGGAEIFAPRARKKLCNDKATAEEWLGVHAAAHRLGLKTNCTMLYGTIETIEERVNHLLQLRMQQDETGGFQAFIPLAYHPEGNRLGAIGAPTGADDLRVIAISRLLLDNIPHIKAYWIMLGIKTAQLAQIFGANDMDGTVTEEKIYHMSGASTPNELTITELQQIIRAVGRTPVERTTTYNLVEAAADVIPCGGIR